MKYFIIWSDYDNDEIEEFDDENIGVVEERISELLHNFEQKDNGSIDKIIYGEEMDFEIVERVKEVKLRR